MAEALEKDATATEAAAAEMILLALLLLRFSGHLSRIASARLDEIEEAVLQAASVVDLTGARRYRVADELGDVALDIAQRGFGALNRDLTAELAALAGLVSAFLVRQIDSAVMPGTARPLPAESLVEVPRDALIEGATLALWLSRQAGDLVFRLRRVVTSAAADGAGSVEASRGVRDAIDGARRSGQTILRTSVTAVVAVTVHRMVRQNSHVIKGYVHNSVLDARTTKLICRPRAGKRWLSDGTPVAHSMPLRVPPLHMGCRSHLSMWFKPAGEMPGEVAYLLRETGRADAFRDRPVPEPTLEEWLRSRPVAEQTAIVGAAKRKAWKAGHLTAAGLLDQAGRPLTSAQIRKILGL